MYNGIINVYKEAGYTSFDVVARLRGILKQKKIGHTGTLDPDAVGVLPVCVGNATKLVDELTDRSKVYECVMLLGVATDTDDISGTIIRKDESAGDYSLETINAAAMNFVGGYEQIPPMFSAIKVNGRRLYELAREGTVIERSTRHVDIDCIEIQKISHYESDDEYNGLMCVSMNVCCGKGTYIRSLCRDIAERLGTCGCMASLMRTRVGRFNIDESFTIDQIEQLYKEGELESVILPVFDALESYDVLHIADEYKQKLDNGNPLPVQAFLENVNFASGEIYRIINAEGQFFALYVYNAELEEFRAKKIFPII